MVQCIFLFSLLIFIFTSQLETKVFTRFTVHTFFFYFFIIEHVIGTIYITFIGNEALEDFVGIDYSKLDYLLLGYSMFMVTYSLGMIFSHVMLEARRKKKLFLYSSRINSYCLKDTIIQRSFLFLLGVGLIISIVTILISLETVPLFVMMENVGDKAAIYSSRYQSGANTLPGYKQMMLFIRVVSVYLFTYYFIKYLLQERNGFLFYGLFSLTVFANLITFRRSPFIWLIIYVFIIFVMINDDLKIKLRKSYLIVAFVVFLLFSLIQWSITKGSVEGIFSVFFTRLILGQPGTLLSYFVVYPDLHDFISFGFSGPLSLLTREVLHVPAYEIYGYLKSGEFSRPIVYNTISIGDFYAGFGYWGVAFAGIISGFIVNFIHLYLSNAKKTGFTLAAVFTLSLMFSKMNSTNILILLTSWGVLQIFLLTVLLNKLRRFP